MTDFGFLFFFCLCSVLCRRRRRGDKAVSAIVEFRPPTATLPPPATAAATTAGPPPSPGKQCLYHDVIIIPSQIYDLQDGPTVFYTIRRVFRVKEQSLIS